MSRKRGRIRRKGEPDRRSEADECVKGLPRAASAGGEAMAGREGALAADEQTVPGREDVCDAGTQGVLGREELVQSREEATDRREETADLREDVATLREQAMRNQEEATRADAARSAQIEVQLSEANDRLAAATASAQAMSESAELATAQMSHMAAHDFLTGLPNRSLLASRLAQSIVLAQHHEKKVAVLCLDLDHFKHINDSLGHAIGDLLLQSAARRLETCIRRNDTVSRQGGDEFVILLSEVQSVQDAALTAEKLLKTMAEPHLIEGHRLHVTLSIGISLYPDDGKDGQTLLRNADTAMNHAKRCGRNDYQRFAPEMNVRAVARQSVEEALRHALEQSEFILHYQPKVNLETGVITGGEALLRWQHPKRLICPSQFVAIAEDCGLILPIGRWVLREACRQTQAWLQAGLEVGQIAVNVSAVEFHSKDFLAGVRAILGDTGLDPRHLELEMTESVLMQDTQPTMALLHALKDLGAQIAIDDFGTGYSSLSYLQRFPIDTLKIDQSFVRGIEGEAGEAIVGAIIAMGTSLKQRVVAEGIETRQQLAFLQSHRCTEGQGYFFGRPVSAGEFAALLATRQQPPAETQ